MSLGTNPMDGGGSRETDTSCDVRGVDTETWTSCAGDPLPLKVPSLLTAHRATFFTGVRCGGAVTYGVRGKFGVHGTIHSIRAGGSLSCCVSCVE